MPKFMWCSAATVKNSSSYAANITLVIAHDNGRDFHQKTWNNIQPGQSTPSDDYILIPFNTGVLSADNVYTVKVVSNGETKTVIGANGPDNYHGWCLFHKDDNGILHEFEITDDYFIVKNNANPDGESNCSWGWS